MNLELVLVLAINLGAAFTGSTVLEIYFLLCHFTYRLTKDVVLRIDRLVKGIDLFIIYFTCCIDGDLFSVCGTICCAKREREIKKFLGIFDARV